MKHEVFHYKTMEELKEKINDLNLTIPLSENTDIIAKKVERAGLEFSNAFAIQPMEGCDAAKNGEPGDLTKRRYERFAKSGAGLIWFEAVAVCPEGKAKPNQLRITEENLDSYKTLIERIKEESLKENGFETKVIMQAAHSGRYSNPNGYSEPIIAYNNPIFEKDNPIDPSRIISDDELERLEEKFEKASKLAEEAGFDGVDIKCCHRYLLSELMSAYDRPGKYGGSLENRSRLYRNSIAAANAVTKKEFIVTSRLNVYDGFEYPYGFGVSKDGGLQPDLTEPKELIKILHEQYDMKMINISIGNPYVTPHVNRPYDHGNYVPEEHPLEGVERIMNCVREIQTANPEMLVVGSGFSYPRQYSPYMAAGALEKGYCSIAGFGREALAYPEFWKDFQNQGMDPKKVCVSCGGCAKLLRAGQYAGCVVRDREFYHAMK